MLSKQGYEKFFRFDSIEQPTYAQYIFSTTYQFFDYRKVINVILGLETRNDSSTYALWSP